MHLLEVLDEGAVVGRGEVAHGAVALRARLVHALDVVVEVGARDGEVAARGAVEPLRVWVELLHVLHDGHADPRDEVAVRAVAPLLVHLLHVGLDVVGGDALVGAAGLRAPEVLGHARGEVLAQDVRVELAPVGRLELALRALLVLELEVLPLLVLVAHHLHPVVVVAVAALEAPLLLPAVIIISNYSLLITE